MDTSVPVVVLDVGYGGLGIARSLGRSGVPLYAVSAGPGGPALASRYWTERLRWTFTGTAPEASIRFLAEVGRKIGRRAVVMPTSDVTAVFVAEHLGVLEEWFLFPRQTPELARALVNKREMYRLAQKAGLRSATTWFHASGADLKEFLAGVEFPVFVKAIDPRLPPGPTKTLCVDPHKVLAIYEGTPDALRENLMAQEYIPGDGQGTWLFNGYFDGDGRCLAAFTGKKVRQYPAYTGVASLGVCARNETIERSAIAFLQAIGYRGPVDIDFGFDPRDGVYKILDVNPRIGASFRLFVDQADLDVARICYLDLTRQTVPTVRPREGRRWMLEDDLMSFWRYRKDGKLTFRDWAGSLIGVQETAWFAFDDPSPLMSRLRHGLQRRRRSMRPGAGDGAHHAES